MTANIHIFKLCKTFWFRTDQTYIELIFQKEPASSVCLYFSCLLLTDFKITFRSIFMQGVCKFQEFHKWVSNVIIFNKQKALSLLIFSKGQKAYHFSKKEELSYWWRNNLIRNEKVSSRVPALEVKNNRPHNLATKIWN